MIQLIQKPHSDVKNIRSIFDIHKQYFDSVWSIIRIAYFMVFIRAMYTVGNSWPVWIDLRTVNPLWPVQWIKAEYWIMALSLIDLGFLGSSFLAMLKPQWRIARIAVFVSFAEFAALASSFGRASHGFHLWLGVLGLLILAPTGNYQTIRGSLRLRHQTLSVFMGIQWFILLCYTLSGLFKVGHGINQLLNGQISAFHSEALALQIANRLNATNGRSILGEIIINYSLIGWPLYFFSIYLETCALCIAKKPILHQTWALGLIGFHMAIWLTMVVPFFDNIIIIFLFLYVSPFVPSSASVFDILRNMPIIAWFMPRKRRSKAY